VLQALLKAKDGTDALILLTVFAFLLPFRLAWLAVRHPVRAIVVLVGFWLFQRYFLTPQV